MPSIKSRLDKIKIFFKEARQELRHVNWPTRKEAFYLTAVVIGLSLVLAIFLGGVDYVFLYILRNVIL